MDNASNAGVDIIRDYVEDRITVEGFLRHCRTFRGDAPHFLLSEEETAAGIPVLVLLRFLGSIPEEKLCILLEAMVAESPLLLTFTRPGWYGLLHVVLRLHPASRLVQLVLAVKESTRLLDFLRMTPLHVACTTNRVDPVVIHRLITLDPDVLTLPDTFSHVPLHLALYRDVSDTHLLSPHVRRMIELRPETLLFRNHQDQTPVQVATYQRRGRCYNLLPLIEQHPRSVHPPDTALRMSTSLMVACTDRPELVRAVLDAYPPALVIPSRCRFNMTNEWLPFNAVDVSIRIHGWRDLSFVWEETVHMALAVVEYVLGANVLRDFQLADSGLLWFQMHVRGTLKELVPELVASASVTGTGTSGLSVVQALRGLDNNMNENQSTLIELIPAWFSHNSAAELLQGESSLLRDGLLCETVVDLYRLNRLGRYRPLVNTHPSPGHDDDLLLAARHQVELLASLRDSTTLDSTYLQFREVSHHVLLVHEWGRNRSRVAQGE